MKAILIVLAIAASANGQHLLPFRNQVAEGQRQQIELLRQQLAGQREIIALMQRPPATPSHPPGPVFYMLPGPGSGIPQTLPIEGQPRQQLPIEGQPRQLLPIEGQPRQVLPIEGPPRQQLPIEGQPRQLLPSSPGEGKPFLPPPGTAKPSGPVAYNSVKTALYRAEDRSRGP